MEGGLVLEVQEMETRNRMVWRRSSGHADYMHNLAFNLERPRPTCEGFQI